MERGMRNVPSARLVNFVSEASFSEKGTCSVPSTRAADSGGLGQGRSQDFWTGGAGHERSECAYSPPQAIFLGFFTARKTPRCNLAIEFSF